MRSFELQTYKDGRWKMNSVFDDRKYAIDEATRLDQTTRYAGVRVIEENYNEETNESTSRTLFRGGVAKSDNAHKPKSAPKHAPQRGGTGRETQTKSVRKPREKKSNILVPVLILMIIILAGLAALFGLQQFPSSK